MSPRQDLLHLKPEALAQAANAGIVKRAIRELESGYRPELALSADGTLDALFSDGIRTIWPVATPIGQVRCSCGAAKVCRHRIIMALTYRQTVLADNGADAPSDTCAALVLTAQPISPGQASDETLARMIPATLMARAVGARRAGLSITVCRTTSGEPCDTARLPSATVRFWAGAALEAARCDCITGTACEHMALGVWAFRQADEDTTQSVQPEQIVRIGSEGTRLTLDTSPWRALVETIIFHGITAGAAPIAQALSHALHASRTIQATWLTCLLQDLEQWCGAWLARSASYQATDGLALVAELALRLHAGTLPNNARAALGLSEPAETELDRVRLVCLGARTVRDGTHRRTRLMLADTDTSTLLVLNHAWQMPSIDTDEARTRAAERLAPGLLLQTLSDGQLLARKAHRLSDGSIKLNKSRSTNNSVLAQIPDWSQLAMPLRYDSVRALTTARQRHPTAQVLPRHTAQHFIVFSPTRIENLSYDPHTQTLMAVLYDNNNQPLLLTRSHENHNRHALATLAQVLSGSQGFVGHVTGFVHWNGRQPVIEPWALATSTIIVPDFAAASIQNSDTLATLPLGGLPDETGSSISEALARLSEVLARLLHHGLMQLPLSWTNDVHHTIHQLKAQSLFVLADSLNELLVLTLTAKAMPKNACLAPALMQLAALAQLHADAQVM